jgi:hypothetical protein
VQRYEYISIFLPIKPDIILFCLFLWPIAGLLPRIHRVWLMPICPEQKIQTFWFYLCLRELEPVVLLFSAYGHACNFPKGQGGHSSVISQFWSAAIPIILSGLQREGENYLHLCDRLHKHIRFFSCFQMSKISI